MARWKGHDPRHRFGRSAAYRADNNVAYMVALVSRSRSGSDGHGQLTQIEEARGPLEVGFLEISCKIKYYKKESFV